MTDAIEKHTVSMYFVDAAVRHLSLAARERVMAQAGIPVQLLGAEHARVPATAFSSLWLAVAQELDDEFFGLDRRAMKVGSFALTAQAAVSCQNLERAIYRTLRAFRVFLDDIRGELVVKGTEAVIRITNRIPAEADRRFADETFLVLIHGLLCWLIGRRIPLTRARFIHEQPPVARDYALMFCNTLDFGSEETSLHFDSAVLQAPVVQNATTLRQFLLTAPQSVFLKYRNDSSWTSQIRGQLRASIGGPGGWPKFEDVATTLGTTATTLRRRLDAEGGNFQSIKDALRSDLAIDYLCNSRISIEEIGPMLGFHDASAFHRAFKRWFGIQPGEYRKRLGNSSAS